MEQLEKISSILSVYKYTLPSGDIPLIIIDEKAERDALSKAYQRSNGCVVITHDDLKHGRDVFALRFLHMQQRSNLVTGEDLLDGLKLKKDNVRNELESILRLLLIDLREMILLPKIHQNALSMVTLALDRILLGIEIFGKKHHKKYEQELETALEQCKKWSIDHEFLKSLYAQIEHLTKKVDDQ